MKLRESITRDVMLRDSLHNASHDCTRNDEVQIHYARGVIVGMVSSFMAQGADFAVALKLVTDYLPTDFDGRCMPESWRTK